MVQFVKAIVEEPGYGGQKATLYTGCLLWLIIGFFCGCFLWLFFVLTCTCIDSYRAIETQVAPKGSLPSVYVFALVHARHPLPNLVICWITFLNSGLVTADRTELENG